MEVFPLGVENSSQRPFAADHRLLRRRIDVGELLETKNEFRTHSFQLLSMGGGKSAEQILAAPGELNKNPATVLR
jgi:hypothetical protein